MNTFDKPRYLTPLAENVVPALIAAAFALYAVGATADERAAIASYTMLISTALPEGVRVAAHNESRVIVKIDGNWKVVHCHKSPAWGASHVSP